MYPSKQFQKVFNGFLFLLIIHIPTMVSAQVLIETLSSTRSEGTINIYGRGTLSERIPYEKITGSPFWANEWKAATLFGTGPKEKWDQKIKLNLATKEIYFISQGGDELVVNDGYVQRIVIYNEADPAKIEATFLNSVHEPYSCLEKIDAFLQVLNDGRYQLLKQNTRKVMEGDSLFGTLKRYFFKYDTKYFIANKYIINPVKKLTMESVLQFVPYSADNQRWISQNKLNLRKEADVVNFLNHLNEKK